MSPHDRVRWDAIYKKQVQQRYPPPDPLLFESTPPVRPDEVHYALDLAGGLGQNGLWLAAQGYTVDIMDISRVALTRARAEMAIRNLRSINLLQVDLDDLDLPHNHYEVVCIFRYLKRSAFPQIKASVAAQGRVIYETYNVRYLEQVAEFNPEFLLFGGELAALFDDWKIVRHEEVDYITRLVAIKEEVEKPSLPAPSHTSEERFTW